MTHQGMKKLLASTLTLALVMGGGTTVFAKDGRGVGNPFSNSKIHQDNGKHLGQLKWHFNDMDGNDFAWALRYIVDLASRGVFQGYPDGTFQPQGTVSRIEAITAAVRLMGLESEAQSSAEMQTKLNFKDAGQIPSWAVGYVAVALENDLFGETETSVHPNQPADRLWATTLLVKALKLQSEAEANMNASLPFTDANKIPAGSVGYVKVAVDRGLINGFEDNTFRPNQSVTRAQIAALMDRAGDQMPGSADGLVNGTVTAPVTNNVLTITSNGQTNNLTLDPNAFIFRGGVRVNASALQAGDNVRTRAYNNTVYYVEVIGSGGIIPGQNPVPVPSNGVSTGTVTAAVNNNTLTLTNGGQPVALLLNPNALFFRNGAQIAASGLQIGDVVSTRSYNNSVVYVEVTQSVGSVPSTTYQQVLNGTITSKSGSNVYLISSGSQTYSMTLNNGAFIYRGGVLVNADALKIGDVVTAYAYNNSTAIVEVTQAVATVPNTNGTITGTVSARAMNNILTITSGGQSYSLTFDANAFVYRNGVQTVAAALLEGDTVTAHYYNGVVLYAEVTQLAGGAATNLAAVTQLSGTIS
ncbi:MAG: S-layer protein, partial [Paenibacillaceae bacterium]|nr:S-layer protein [Paenibacillaceae bacterium]